MDTVAHFLGGLLRVDQSGREWLHGLRPPVCVTLEVSPRRSPVERLELHGFKG